MAKEMQVSAQLQEVLLAKEANVGIIFGQYLLPEQVFKDIFKEWYFQKGEDFKNQLDSQIITPINKMIEPSSRYSNSKGKNVSVIKKLEEYNAKKIYDAWEKLTKDFFGNDGVDIIAVTNFGGGKNTETYNWSAIIPESDVMTRRGIDITKTKGEELKNKTQDFLGAAAAAQVDATLNEHYGDLLKSLNIYKMSHNAAQELHVLFWLRKSKLINEVQHFTGKSYNQAIYDTQKNADGKKIDAFMNHIGNYHVQLFDLMKYGRINADNLINANFTIPAPNESSSFVNYFQNKINESQVWMLDSLNSASWLTGGDVVVVNDNYKVIYNIQLKSSYAQRGKMFELALKALKDLAEDLYKAMDFSEKSVDHVAEIMFNSLKTSTTSDIQKMSNDMAESIKNIIRDNLGLKK